MNSSKKIRVGAVLLALVALMGALLSACSTSGNKANQSVQENSNQQVKEASAVQSEEIVLKHAMGETKLSSTPKRIVVLDNGALDNLLALGVKPVGAPTVLLDQPYPAYLGSQTEGIGNIGTVDEPNLESVANMNPDLILGSKDTHELIYDKLSQIAPTVFVETLGYTWKDNLKLQGQAVGKSSEAEQLLAQYKQRSEDFKSQFGEQIESFELSILRPRADHVRIYLKESFSGIVADDLGLKRPAAQQGTGLSVNATEEQVADMDGDVIIWFSRDKEHLLNTKLESNPLWKNLEAVKTNQVYQVNDETWLSGLGIQAANLVVDDLFKILLPAGK